MESISVGSPDWQVPATASRRGAEPRCRITRGCAPGSKDGERNRKVRELETIARELRATTAQLAIAWCTKNPSVASVILGASGPRQLQENLGALDVVPRLSGEVMLAHRHHLREASARSSLS